MRAALYLAAVCAVSHVPMLSEHPARNWRTNAASCRAPLRDDSSCGEAMSRQLQLISAYSDTPPRSRPPPDILCSLQVECGLTKRPWALPARPHARDRHRTASE
eukprot:5816822-Pyramimonas_sp.AAC.1